MTHRPLFIFVNGIFIPNANNIDSTNHLNPRFSQLIDKFLCYIMIQFIQQSKLLL